MYPGTAAARVGLVVALVLALAAAAPAPEPSSASTAAPFLGPDLLANGGFEQTDAAGHPTAWQVSHRTHGAAFAVVQTRPRAGARCAHVRLAGPADNEHLTLLSDPVPMAPASLYRLMGWCRQSGKRLQGQHNDYVVIHLAFADPQGRALAGPEAADTRTDLRDQDCDDWQLFDKIFRTPPEAASARLAIQFHRYKPGNTPEFWLDGLHLQPWRPPDPPAQALCHLYLAKTRGVNGQDLPDPDASGGRSHQTRLGVNRPGGVISGPIITDQLPGLYRVLYRLKVADNRSPDPVVTLCVAAGGLWDSHSYVLRSLRGIDFAAAGRYQEFAIDFLRPPMAGMQYLLTWHARTDLAVDTIRVLQTHLCSDRELIACYHLDELRLMALAPGPPSGRVLVLHGLHADHWRIDQAVAAADLAGGPIIHYRLVQGYGSSEPPFPQDLAQLRPYRAVVLAGADADCLSGIFGRKALADYVRAGGGLVVLGGLLTYGAGKFRGTLVEEMLPVELAGPFDLKPLGRGQVIQPAPQALSLPWPDQAVCLWQHVLQPKPGATVAASTPAGPFLVLGTYGRGRVAAFLGTVLGEAPEGPPGFWQADSWPATLGGVIRHVAGP